MTAIKNIKKTKNLDSLKLNWTFDLISFTSNFYEWDLILYGNIIDGFKVHRLNKKIGSTILFELMKICEVCHTNLIIDNENCVSIY